jgi:hypothetical protein
MKVRKKPVVVDAERFWSNQVTVIAEFIEHLEEIWSVKNILYQNGQKLYIRTLEGTLEVTVGDWIICGVNGELYPCKPDIFDKTYDILDDAEIRRLHET